MHYSFAQAMSERARTSTRPSRSHVLAQPTRATLTHDGDCSEAMAESPEPRHLQLSHGGTSKVRSRRTHAISWGHCASLQLVRRVRSTLTNPHRVYVRCNAVSPTSSCLDCGADLTHDGFSGQLDFYGFDDTRFWPSVHACDSVTSTTPSSSPVTL